MKELAEQAATGTYNSDQRLMINSEFQAMKAEIDRIAKATDFNGVKLLSNDPANKLLMQYESDPYITQGRINSYGGFVNLESNEILNPDAITKDANLLYSTTNALHILNCTGNTDPLDWGFIMGVSGTPAACQAFVDYGQFDIKYDSSLGIWTSLDSNINVQNNISNDRLSIAYFTGNGEYAWTALSPLTTLAGNSLDLDSDCILTLQAATGNAVMMLDLIGNYNNIKYMWQSLSGKSQLEIDLDNDGIIDIRQIYSGALNNSIPRRSEINIFSGKPEKYTTKIHFGTGNDSAEDYYYIDTKDCTAQGLGIAGTSIETQDKAQRALEEINNAVITKDAARAYFGAIQNRLENTASNLQIQAENLQASESRISDVDVSCESKAPMQHRGFVLREYGEVFISFYR